jgi:hypothetical protein
MLLLIDNGAHLLGVATMITVLSDHIQNAPKDNDDFIDDKSDKPDRSDKLSMYYKLFSLHHSFLIR